MFHGDVTARFFAAVRHLQHWQQVAGVGRPEEWGGLGIHEVAEFARRVEIAKQSHYGTEQVLAMEAIVAEMSAPPPEPATETVADAADHEGGAPSVSEANAYVEEDGSVQEVRHEEEPG